MILDSGDRTQFESGAVRDMKKGKGRCDLMPVEAIFGSTGDMTFRYIESYLETKYTLYLKNCLKHVATTYYMTKEISQEVDESKVNSSCVANMLLEASIQFEEGASKYGEDNWKKGIPTSSYVDSAIRHYLKHLRGDTDENHLRAFVWNIMCLIWTEDNKKKLGVE